MIKLIIKQDLIEKHRKYLVNKNIDKRLESFQRNTKFFGIRYLNKLVKLNVKKEKRYSDEMFFLEDFTFEKQKKLLKQHFKFINYLIEEVNDLEKCEEYSECKNLFLAKPDGLNRKRDEIKRRFKYIYEFLKLQNENAKNECTYASELRSCLGYSEFSNEKMNYYYKYELEKIKMLKEINRYKGKLMLDQAPHLYSEGNLNSIKRYILDDINEINQYDKENEVLNEFLQIKLFKKIEELPVTDSEGKSIGIIKFFSEIKGIINNTYNILKSDKKFQNIAITFRNIDIYNVKYGAEWGAYHFLMELGIKSCPYCNRQYISPIYSENGKMRADLDHFYSKSRYPYFSISIFNLVPSCKFCNSSLKSNYNFEFDNNLSPYEDGFGERLKFSFEIKSYEDFLGDNKVRVYLKENIRGLEGEQDFLDKAKENAKVFQIENLYNYHTDEVKELIRKRIEYSDSCIENLIKSYNEKLYRNETEVLEAILGYQVDDECLSEKNLAKFTRDICEELGFVFRKSTVSVHQDIQLIINKYSK